MRKWFTKLSKAVRPAAPSVAPVTCQQEELEGRRLMSSSLAYGINANSITASNYPHVVKMLRDTGAKTVRAWVSIYSWDKKETGVFKYVRKFASDGFDVTASVVPHQKGGSSETIRDYFNWIGKTLGSSVGRFQVGNEIDKDMGNLTGYVTDMLRPAAAGLHAAGEKVVSGAVSWNPDDVKKMANAGMLDYVDYVGYHPYRNSVAQLKSAIAEIRSFTNKPLVATEWNVRGHEGNSGEWQQAIKEYWPTIRDNFYAAYYFAAIKINSMAGPSGVITKDGSQNGGFYSTFKSLGGNNGGGGTVTPTNPTTPTTPDDDDNETPTTGGNTPSSSGKASIGSFRLFDGVTGKIIKGYENVTAGTTIKLSSLPHTKIQIRAMTSSNAKSVKFSFTGRGTRSENNAPFTAFANSKGAEAAWQAVKGSYTLSATAYTQQFLKGTAGTALALTLKFV